MSESEWTVATLLEHFNAVLAERDARYRSEFEGLRREVTVGFAGQKEAVGAALTAAKEATGAAFAAAEKAVSKAESAQDDRLAAHNGLQQQLKERDAETPSRKEMDLLIRPLADKLGALENWRSKATGVGAVLVLFSGLAGAAIVRALGG